METTENRAKPPRVLVTGVGAVCAWGWGREALRRGLASGETAIRDFSRFDHSRQRTHLAGEVPETGSPRPWWPRLSLADRFAVFSALEALAQAELEPSLGERKAGVYFASSTGGLYEAELFLMAMTGGGRPRADLIASQQLNGPGDAVARRLGVTGPVVTVSSACSSGTLALEAALRDLRAGIVDVAIAGGSDSLCRITYSGFNALRAVDERPCRPYRADRAGMSLGEGAGALILETEAHALGRGVRALAELKGAGASCDASHMTAPHPEGLGAALAMTRALRDGETDPATVAFVNVHGTGTPVNDPAECRALQSVFGDRVAHLPLTATKASIGHLLGSAGAVEAVATVLCLESGWLDPAAGGGEVDPALPVDLVLGAPRRLEPGPAVTVNLAFGGANAALVFGRAGAE
jgi:3-oxoacyl-[acyl-carrier-protein] synthase II